MTLVLPSSSISNLNYQKFVSDTHLEGSVRTLETRSKSKAIFKNLFQNISTIRGSAIFRKDKSNPCRGGVTFEDHSEHVNHCLRSIIKNAKSKGSEHRLS